MSAYTIEQYHQLCAMMAKGVTSLEQNGEKVTFRSLDEMRRIKSEMEQALGFGTKPRVHYPTFLRG